MSTFDIPWQLMIDTAPDGLCVLDAAGKVQYANPAALALLGLTSPEGEPIAELLDAEYGSLLVEAKSITPNGGTLVRVRRDYEFAAAENMAILIHDLRLPMTSIVGYAKMLQTIGAEALTDMQRQFLDTIDRNVNRLDQYLQAAQEMTRIDRAKVKLTLAAQSPGTFAAAVIHEFRPLVEEKGHHVTLDLPDDLPTVYADAEHLNRILHILLDNAMKYTPSNGQIRVHGRCTKDQVQIDVEDNGIGIPLAEQKRVFSRFFRGEDERIREYPGLGLSLYIARGLTQLQNGQLWFKSTPDQGSTFSLVLPASKAP
jgi:signal transduction histidine kinase